MGVIPGALAKDVLIVDAGPIPAGVVGAEDAAVGSFHDGPDAFRIGRGDGDADASQNAARQAGAARDVGPGVAAVGRLPQSAAGSAAVEMPGIAAHLPK